MLLSKDRILGETAMNQFVPIFSPQFGTVENMDCLSIDEDHDDQDEGVIYEDEKEPSFISNTQFDFDLELLNLPSNEFNGSIEASSLIRSSTESHAPNSPSSISPVLSPTMYSPQPEIKGERRSVAARQRYGSAGSLGGYIKSEPLFVPSSFSQALDELYSLQNGLLIKTEEAIYQPPVETSLPQCIQQQINNDFVFNVNDMKMENNINENIEICSVKEEPLDELPPMMEADHIDKEIEATCELLDISSDPRNWNSVDIRRWIVWTVHRLSLPPLSESCLKKLEFSSEFAFLDEIELISCMPQGGGDKLFSELEKWRNLYMPILLPPPEFRQFNCENSSLDPVYCPDVIDEKNECFSLLQLIDSMEQNYNKSTQDSAAIRSDERQTSALGIDEIVKQNISNLTCNPVTLPQPMLISPSCPSIQHSECQQSNVSSPATDIASNGECYDDIEQTDDDIQETTSGISKADRRHSSSSNIHLWQFVKDLLLQPHLYSSCIQWIDRSSGIFRIVDSVKVATLWGQRKNRPAMNYDKLSRSLRQYYKKSIMKKTDRSQRLVYQFCSPYHL